MRKYCGDNSTPYITFLRPDNYGGVGRLRGRMLEFDTDERLAKRIKLYNFAGRNFGRVGGHDVGKSDSVERSFFTEQRIVRRVG